MSHHFDVKLAKENPVLNVCDVYIFEGSPGHTVMALTVSADVGKSSPDVLPTEAVYAFRFDINGDNREDVVFKFRFEEPRHHHGDEHTHAQRFKVIRAEGADIGGVAGNVLVEGETGRVTSQRDVKVFVGKRPDLWAANAIGFFDFLSALYGSGRFDTGGFANGKNFFERRNVIAMVLEVPNGMLGDGDVRVWGTVSLVGHAPEVQIYRWGLPLFTHLYLSDPKRTDLPERFHNAGPENDVDLFSPAVTSFVSNLAGRAGFTDDPDTYGEQVASRLCPAVLPYKIGSPAAFELMQFNGRPLGIDAFDVMLTLAANTSVADGVGPNTSRISKTFPYFGEPFSESEQADLAPISTGFY